MDTLELNKYVGAVLSTLLAMAVIGHIGDALIHSEELKENVVQIAVSEGPAEAAKEEGTGKEESVSALSLLASADAEAGQNVAKKCAACHSFEKGGPNKVGPNLWNVVGGPKAHVSDFNYSSAMAEAGGKWTWEELDAFLANPRGTVKGTKMSFAGVKKPQQRADLLAYLRTLSDSPQPLP